MTNIITKGIHVSITNALQDHVQEQFSNLTEHYEHFIKKYIKVTLEVESKHTTNLHIVKAIIPVKGNDIFVESNDHDMYQAISGAMKKANSQLNKLKSKNNNKRVDKKNMFIEAIEPEEEVSF